MFTVLRVQCSSGWTLSNMITDAPVFTDSANGDYSLVNGFNGIDDGTGTDAPAEDINGTSRPQNGFFDMGAYEY